MELSAKHDLLQGNAVMPSHLEVISFDNGLNLKDSSIVLKDGELVEAQGMSYDTTGIIEARTSKSKLIGVSREVNGIHQNDGYVIALGSDGTLKYNSTSTPLIQFSYLGVLSNADRPIFCDYEDFTFIVNGDDKKVFLDGAWYEWDIDAPTVAPSASVGASGNPSGTYSLYYTYLITFPNGTVVETAPSPAGTVAVTAQKIEWSGIGICAYVGATTIHRKLYRTSTALVETYYVTTLTNNTATTYSDNFSDATLEINSIIETADYTVAPDNTDYTVEHIERVFCIKDNYLYPSVPYQPFNFDSTEVIQVTAVNDNIIAGAAWGDQLCLATTNKWYRLHGSDSDTWMIKNTYAHTGIINKYTIVPTRHGILGLWYDGIYLFDGSVSKNITNDKLNKTFFSETISDLSSCYSSWDGRKYYFHYPISGTTISKRLVIDMTKYPDVKIYNDDFVPNAHEYYPIDGTNNYGYQGSHYQEGGSDVCILNMTTGDRVCKDLTQQKQLEYFYYDCFTNDKDLKINIYIDDVLQHTITLNNSARTKDRVTLPNKQGYRISVNVSADDFRGMTIYEPWVLSVNPTGV